MPRPAQAGLIRGIRKVSRTNAEPHWPDLRFQPQASAPTGRNLKLEGTQTSDGDHPARRDGITSAHPSAADLLATGRRLAAALQFGTEDTLTELPEDGPGLPLGTLARGCSSRKPG